MSPFIKSVLSIVLLLVLLLCGTPLWEELAKKKDDPNKLYYLTSQLAVGLCIACVIALIVSGFAFIWGAR